MTYRKKLLTLALMVIALIPQLLFHNIAFALPSGSQIVNGSGSLQSDGTTLTVQQHSNKMSIDYNSFDISQNETVQFIQPGRDSIALNRVTGSNPSQILGQLNANGQIFLINPNGVIFGAGATVEVGGLLASTLQLSNEDFLAGHYEFSAAGQAEIINRGLISATDQGYLAFISNHVTNEGEMNAPKGSVELHSADKIMVTFSQQAVSIESTQATVDGLIENHGLITSDSGYIVLNSNTLNTLQETVVNNTGIIRASSMIEKDGAVMIIGSGGDVFNDGLIDVSAIENNVDGGKININAERIALRGSLKANGEGLGNGGTLHTKAKDELFATASSTATADGGIQGNGGEVIYFSDHNALFADGASITARGGDAAGDGGFVEVSGLHWVSVKGFVDTRAPYGVNGTFLIDPSEINIVAGSAAANGSFIPGGMTTGADWINAADTSTIGVDDIRAQLLTTSVYIDTAQSDNAGTGTGGAYQGSGDINVNAALDLDGTNGNTVFLKADRNININANICDGGATCQATPDDNVNLIFSAANQLTIAEGVEVNSGNAKITIVAGLGGAQVTGLVSSNSAENAIFISTTGAITNSGDTLTDLTNNSGGATLIAGSGIDLDTNLNRLTLTNSTSGAVIINELNSLALVSANVDTNFTLNTGSHLTLINDIDLEGANGAIYTLNSGADLIFNDAIGIADTSGADDVVTLNLTATNNIILGTTSAGDLNSYGGDININAGGSFDKQTSTINSGSGKINITANAITLRGNTLSSNASADAIQMTSSTFLVDGNEAGIDIQAINGGAILTANGLLRLDTDTPLLSLTNTGGITDIDSANSTTLSNLQFSGGDANIDTLTGDIIVSNAINTNGADGNTLALNAANDLNINANICDGGAVCAATPDDNINLSLNANGDINLDNAVILHVQDLSMTALAGTITLPDMGLTAIGDITLNAQDIISNSNRTVSITANDLIYAATAATGDTIINTQVARIDAVQGANNLTINQEGDLAITDLNSDSIAMAADNGNLLVTLANGDLSIQDTLSATDGTADGIRSGMIDLQVNNGQVNIGTTGSASIQSINTMDEGATGGLGIDPTSQVAIRIQQQSNLDATQNFTLGDGIGNDVSISATGGDILIDALGGSSINNVNTRLVLLNSDVSISSTNSGAGLDGLITYDGVSNDNMASIIAHTNQAILLRGSIASVLPPIPPTIPEEPTTPLPPELIEDLVPTINQTETTQDINDIQSDLDKQLIAQVKQSNYSFKSVFKACTGNSNNSKCDTENTLKSFLNSFLIGGELPTLQKGI